MMPKTYEEMFFLFEKEEQKKRNKENPYNIVIQFVEAAIDEATPKNAKIYGEILDFLIKKKESENR